MKVLFTLLLGFLLISTSLQQRQRSRDRNNRRGQITRGRGSPATRPLPPSTESSPSTLNNALATGKISPSGMTQCPPGTHRTFTDRCVKKTAIEW